MERFRLDGQVAVVTGGSRGIGRASALALAEAGAQVVVSSRKLEACQEVVAEIEAQGGQGLAVAAHSGKLNDIQRLMDQAREHYGRIDILLNNAGTSPSFGPAIQTEEWAWDKVMEVNLKGYFFASTAAAQVMSQQGSGCIINMASVAGIVPSPMLAAYSISKAGVIALTKALAAELGGLGIRVNAIAPGLIKTKFSQVLWETPEIYQRFLSATPLGRMGEPEEVAAAVVFLASPAASYISSEVIEVTGGGTLG